MKERPILFNGPMVHAVLGGRKTQTRRVVKLPPGFAWENPRVEGFSDTFPWSFHAEEEIGFRSVLVECPYGQSGDRLWVRETWAGYRSQGLHAVYRADGVNFTPEQVNCVKWCPSIHMPRWASRTTLEVTGVRVEQLQGISEENCVAEGVERLPEAPHLTGPNKFTVSYGHGNFSAPTAREAFAFLWNELATPGFTWADNPWVWVVDFKRVLVTCPAS